MNSKEARGRLRRDGPQARSGPSAGHETFSPRRRAPRCTCYTPVGRCSSQTSTTSRTTSSMILSNAFSGSASTCPSFLLYKKHSLLLFLSLARYFCSSSLWTSGISPKSTNVVYGDISACANAVHFLTLSSIVQKVIDSKRFPAGLDRITICFSISFFFNFNK